MSLNHTRVFCEPGNRRRIIITKKEKKSQKHAIVFSTFFVGVFLCVLILVQFSYVLHTYSSHKGMTNIFTLSKNYIFFIDPENDVNESIAPNKFVVILAKPQVHELRVLWTERQPNQPKKNFGIFVWFFGLFVLSCISCQLFWWTFVFGYSKHFQFSIHAHPSGLLALTYMSNRSYLTRIKIQFQCSIFCTLYTMYTLKCILIRNAPFHSENNPSNIDDRQKQNKSKKTHYKITHWIDFPFSFCCCRYISTKHDTSCSVVQIPLTTHQFDTQYSFGVFGICYSFFIVQFSTESFSMNDLIFNAFRLQIQKKKRKKKYWRENEPPHR